MGKNVQQLRVLDFISTCASAVHLEVCWIALKSHLLDFGFDRILFASKAGANKSNLHNLFGTYILSSYGSEIENLFIKNRGFVDDFTVNWLLENNGAISWQVNRDRYLEGRMSGAEERLHLATRQLGLVNGYSYTSCSQGADYAAGFGLCAVECIEQECVDAVWAAEGRTIEALLDVFLLTFRRIPIAFKHETLAPDALEILRYVYFGKTNAEIAQLMGCHRRTVEQKLLEARRVMDAANSAQLVAKLVAQAQLL